MKRHAEIRRLLLKAFALAFVVFLGGCSSASLASRWTTDAITVDGDLRDWTDSTVFVEKDGLRLGVMNDDEYIYVALTSASEDPSQRPMLRGLTVWFDPAGGTDKVFGLRYPRNPAEMSREREATDGETPGSAGMFDREQISQEFEWLGPKEDDLEVVPKLNNNGVQVELRRTRDGFAYEARVPLKNEGRHMYAVETVPGRKVGVGIETGPGRAIERRPPEGMREGGGGGGGRGRGMGGRGRMPGGARPEGAARSGARPESVHFWYAVQLAEGSSSSTIH